MESRRLSGEQFCDLLYEKGSKIIIPFCIGGILFIHGMMYAGIFLFYTVSFISYICGLGNSFDRIVASFEAIGMFAWNHNGIFVNLPCFVIYFYLCKYIYQKFR